jgi:hypothetical protein
MMRRPHARGLNCEPVTPSKLAHYVQFLTMHFGYNGLVLKDKLCLNYAIMQMAVMDLLYCYAMYIFPNLLE